MSSSESDCETQLTLEEIKGWTNAKLKEELKRRTKATSGKKEQLVNRLFKALNEESSSGTDSEEWEVDVVFPSYKADGWVEMNPDDLPPIKQDDIDNYFIFRKNPVTGHKKNCKRQLKKAKKFAKESDYLGSISTHNEHPDYMFFKTTCVASMKDLVYKISLTVSKKTGAVYSAYCTCKAGGAGVCSHIGALVIRLVSYKNVCTSRLCAWREPKDPGASKEPARVSEITFSSDKSVRPFPDTYQASACKDPDVFLADLLEGLGAVHPQCVLYKTMCERPPDISHHKTMYELVGCHLGDKEDLRSHWELFSKCADGLKLSREDVEQIEIATRGQSSNPLWKEMRSYMITSSNFGQIMRRKASTPPDNLVKQLRGYSKVPEHVASLTYGRKMEKKALRAYAQIHIQRCTPPAKADKFSGEDRGLLVSTEFPFLGTSVDGVVSCYKCGSGLVEIKCPFTGKSCKSEELPEFYESKKMPFCASLDASGKLKLDQKHHYYSQLIGQMGITGMKWVDFVIWTKRGEPSIERISFDKSVWDSMVPKLREFYVKGMVAELYSGRVERGIPLYANS